MKRIYIALVVFVMFSNSHILGQTFGIRGGLNLSNLLNKDDDVKYSEEYKTKAGFNLGVTLDIPVTEPLLFETGLIIDSKGYKRDYTQSNVKNKITLNTYYLDIPLHFKYMFQLGNIKPYLMLGPYIGFGMSGKVIHKTIVSGVSHTDSNAINWGNDDDSDLKRFDGGLDFGAGLEFGNFLFGASYSLGLVNICPQPQNGQKYNNRVFSLFLGYRFGRQ